MSDPSKHCRLGTNGRMSGKPKPLIVPDDCLVITTAMFACDSIVGREVMNRCNCPEFRNVDGKLLTCI